jgi:hypothetical protein
MLPNHLDMLRCLAHANELLSEAEEARLAKQALVGRKARIPLLSRAAAWLGRWKVLWGSLLQQHRGAAPIAPMPRAVGGLSPLLVGLP